jgi:uncharacterized protein (DUF58 family)
VALLSPDLRARLARLTLGSRRRADGVQHGERRSQRRGNSQEYADHRPYAPGDDLRFLDWHLYGRLDALWIKLFEAEQDRVVHVLLDASASMAGEKIDCARQVAAALAFVSLGRADRVAVAALDVGLRDYAPPRRGRDKAGAVFQTLEAITAGGGTDLVTAVDAWPRQRGPGIALLFTDFLCPEGPEPLLRRLLGRGLELHVLHVIAPAEVRPDLEGEVLVVDSETGEEVAVTASPRALDAYEAGVRAWLDDVACACTRLGVGYARLLTSVPVEDLVLRDLRRLGLLG